MVKTITRNEFDAEVDEVLRRTGMSRDQFIEAGRSDRLDSEELRTLWLIAGPVLAPGD